MKFIYFIHFIRVFSSPKKKIYDLLHFFGAVCDREKWRNEKINIFFLSVQKN